MPENHLELYFPLLLQIAIAFVLATGLVGASAVLGHRLKNKVKDTPYECGMEPVGDARQRFSVKFYLVAMLFILFDIEAIFLFPWVVVYRDLGFLAFFSMLVFILLILTGFFYIWKKGALEWGELEKPGTKL
ncbi:MAG: NADH-quinone oxidoreductase subunit A [Bryobacterales bacterium]|nr:NADH-quinone oxidoreductase subunit A [Bryobacterales bacterium]